MSPTPRERARAQTMAEILRIGRAHLATDGAAALSLRAVARDLGVVSSAVYRYVASRDDLLTLLLVDGYDSLGDAVDGALTTAPADDHRERFLVLARAVRTWALAETSTYALLFGAPVPGYRAPEESTTGPGTRVPRALVRIAADAHAAGVLAVPDDDAPPPALAAGLEGIRTEFGIDLPDAVLVRGVLAWAAVFGLVGFEVFGQYGPGGLGDPAALFERQVAVLADDLGLP